MKILQLLRPKKIFQIVKSGIVRSLTSYTFNGHRVKIFKNSSKAVVYLDGEIVFSNLKNNEEFKLWWNRFKKAHKHDGLKKTSIKKLSEIEANVITDKISKTRIIKK